MNSAQNFISCCIANHHFNDLCSLSEHKVAFIARHLHEAIEGAKLYKEPYTKEKIKTLTVALVICLNIDIDPPDVQKIPPFSRVEAWIDPTDSSSVRALEMIGKNLQTQYERWQQKARCKQCLDPTLDDVKKLCISLRRNAKDDRILFHYNGHGVPRPTENGEIWVFNKTFTKYIPLSLYDLQRWLGGPSVYVIDCQNAGRVLKLYEGFCQRRKNVQLPTQDATNLRKSFESFQPEVATGFAQTNQPGVGGGVVLGNPIVGPNNNAIPPTTGLPLPQQQPNTTSLVTMENTIMLAACRENEDLPQHPDLPADLFTACLTTPIRTSLKWHWLKYRDNFPGYIDEAFLDRIPGAHSNRMSLLGEINWIFTAVTDTIAWCSFPIKTFQKLFRQDLLVASLYRNFLLAERLMRVYGCHPCSWPVLTPTHEHQMWLAWDHSLDRLFHYLPQALQTLEASASSGPYTDLNLLPHLIVNKSQQSHRGQQYQHANTNGQHTVDIPAWLSMTEFTNVGNARLNSMFASAIEEAKRATETAALLQYPPPGYSATGCVSQRSLGGTRAKPEHQSWSVTKMRQSSDPLNTSIELTQPCSVTIRDGNLTTVTNTITTTGLATRPKFVIEPSASNAQQEAIINRKQQSGLARISEEQSGVLLDEEKKDANVVRETSTDQCSHSYPSTNSIIDEEAIKDCENKEGMSEESDVSSNDLDDGYDDEDEEEEDEEDEVPAPPVDVVKPVERTVINTQQAVPIISVKNTILEGKSEVARPQPLLLSQEPTMQTQKLVDGQLKFLQPQLNVQPSQLGQPPTAQQPNSSGFERSRRLNAAPLFNSDLYAAAAAVAADGGGGGESNNNSSSNLALLFHQQQQQQSTSPNFSSHAQPTPTPTSSTVTTSVDFRPASFFTTQMTAFKVWLRTANEQRQTATQLPILLQVLLSQSHRIRALQLLSEFLDLGSWAVSHCLTVGILPYIVRLFHSNVAEVKPHLVFIWGKIIASAHNTDFGQNEQNRESAYKYFIYCLLNSGSVGSQPPQSAPMLSPLVRAISAFALAKMLEKEASGAPDAFLQTVYCKHNFIEIVLKELRGTENFCDEADAEEERDESDREDLVHLRLWLILALGRLWFHNDESRWYGASHGAHTLLMTTHLVHDVSPIVRAASVFALGTFIDNHHSFSVSLNTSQSTRINNEEQALELTQQITNQLIRVAAKDVSPLVRREVVVALTSVVRQFEKHIVLIAHRNWLILHELLLKQTPINVTTSRHTSSTLDTQSMDEKADNIYSQLWKAVLRLCRDPDQSVSKLACIILVYIIEKVVRTYKLERTVSVQDDSRLYVNPSCCQDEQSHDVSSSIASLANTSFCVKTNQFQGLQSEMNMTQNRSEPTSFFSRPRKPSQRLVSACGFPASTDNDDEEEEESAGVGEITSLGLEHVCTEFFAWSAKWFAQPLLKKYPTALDLHFPASDTVTLNSGSQRKRNKNDSGDNRLPFSSEALAALSAVSGDPDVVSFSDRISRFTEHVALRRVGRFRWQAIATETKMAPETITASNLETTALPLSTPCGHLSTPPPILSSGDCSRVVVVDRVTMPSLVDQCHSLILFKLLMPPPAAKAGSPLLLRFHPYLPHLLASDGKNGLTSWDTRRGDCLAHFTNPSPATNRQSSTKNCGNGRVGLAEVIASEIIAAVREDERGRSAMPSNSVIGGRVTGVEIVNSSEERSLAITASDDGCIRVWANYDGRTDGSPPYLLTAWVGFSDLLRTNCPGAGVVTNWSDCSNQLTISGDVPLIRLFDTERESCVRDMPSESDVCVTRLVRSLDDRLVAAGFGDGFVRLFDVRAPVGQTQIFCSAAVDLASILDIGFSPNGRLYAVSSNGCIGAWQLSGRGEEALPTMSRFALPQQSEPFVVCDPVPREAVISSNNTSSISGLNCASLQVALPCSKSHLIASVGVGSDMAVSRLCDGKVINVYKPSANASVNSPSSLGENSLLRFPVVPTCAAFHPYEPLMALGMSDSSVHLLQFRVPV